MVPGCLGHRRVPTAALAPHLQLGARHTEAAGSAEIRTAGRATLVAVNGPRVSLILAVPVLAAALASLPWPARFRQPSAVAGAVIVGGFVPIRALDVAIRTSCVDLSAQIFAEDDRRCGPGT